MRIAFISIMSGSQWGGSEELWSRTAIFCRKKGNDVIAGVYQWDEEADRLKELSANGINLLKVERSLNQPKRFYKRIAEQIVRRNYKSKYQRFLDQISAFAPDVMCISQGGTFNISAITGLYNFLVSTTIPFVIICQHNQEFGGGFDNKQALFEIELFDKAKKVLFVAKRNLETAERQLASDIKNALIIGNPLNIVSPDVLEYRVPSNTLTMACVARLESIAKGQDIFLQVLSNKIWRKRDYHLNLYGAGPDYNYLARLISFYKLEEKVTLKGHVKDVEAIWRENQLLVLPSISEGTPLSLLEAMLCGRAVLATDVGDISSYVIDGRTGFLVPFATRAALADALEKMWNNRYVLKEMGENAYSHALSTVDLNPEQTLINIIMKASFDVGSKYD